jgi:glycosyltransferase involved in cell wall biosynthesis
VKLLYVVQRYGEDIVGGSEAACRQFAEALTASGHTVEVLTSCARSYVDWEDSYESGTSQINGVTVHRLPVLEKRLPERFGPTDMWLMSEQASPLLFEQERWALLMGPAVRDLRTWLIANSDRFDAAIFMTYLYSTATKGIPALAGRLPLIFQPTAHDEPSLRVPIFESLFRLPDFFLFFTPEERQVVQERFNIEPEGRVIGIGIDLNPPVSSVGSLRERFDLNDDPYLVYVGRLDPNKGVLQLCNFFIELKKQFPSTLKLVLAGDPLVEMPEHADIRIIGFQDEADKHAIISGSLALVQSSFFESFSIVLCEAWVQKRPALVQGASTVLRGQAVRSTGAIPYEGYAEFEQAVMMLLENPTLADELGRNGRKYVEDTYEWAHVLKGFEESLIIAQERFQSRPISLRSSD